MDFIKGLFNSSEESQPSSPKPKTPSKPGLLAGLQQTMTAASVLDIELQSRINPMHLPKGLASGLCLADAVHSGIGDTEHGAGRIQPRTDQHSVQVRLF